MVVSKECTKGLQTTKLLMVSTSSNVSKLQKSVGRPDEIGLDGRLSGATQTKDFPIKAGNVKGSLCLLYR